ncbi:site-specific integrase [Nitrospirillum sp. BR 11164]|uniref:tyrosine-type recombinase/integrase n=1 Tax=Nitrospirillum sp. BR 11164 TaxID=3104324 RepID=UPI002AFE60E1|nr:site-specific integrase [Nitrospirillum sp. BR 11164]MEA1649199.1 site-specific integrase [Nitrospirillum sp. BR 11164]
MAMAVKLTERVVKGLEPPASGNKITYDSEVSGFGARVTALGKVSFVLNYRAEGGRERRITIGSWPDWPVETARSRAKELKRQVDLGEDPMGDRHARRAAPTVLDLAERYREEHLPKKRAGSAKEDERNLRVHVLPRLGKMKVADVRFSDVDRLHQDISRTAPYAANRVLSLLSKLFNLAIKWEVRTDNPVKGVDKNAEEKRKRYLSGVELVALTEVLQAHRERSSANVVRLLLLTGARRGEVLSARWDQFDLTAGLWVKPGATTKQKTEHRVPLSAPARQLLAEMRAQAEKVAPAKRSPFVFPGDTPTRPMKDISSFWRAVTELASVSLFAAQPETLAGRIAAALQAKLGRLPTYREWLDAAKAEWAGRPGESIPAGLTDVRVHDLRHTYASILVSAGLSLPIIGALLGHTQAQTTARYAHLMDDPLRAATERVGAILESTARPTAEVVNIQERVK